MPTEGTSSLLGHLDELRKRLVIIAVFFFIAVIVSFIFAGDVYKFLTKDLPEKLMVLGPADAIWIYFTIALMTALAITIPFIAWQIWLFVKPALKKKEQKATLLYIPALFLLFIAGIAFGYFVILPFLLVFLKNFAADLFEVSYEAERYFSFIMRITIPFGFLFEMPLVMMFLTSLRIINPYVLAKIRKYAYFALFIVAAMLTPPDFFSQIFVAIPLIGLFEISVMVSKIVYRRQVKRDKLDADEGEADESATDEATDNTAKEE